MGKGWSPILNPQTPLLRYGSTNDRFVKNSYKLRVPFTLVTQEGFEPSTAGLENLCSIQLSYWAKIKDEVLF